MSENALRINLRARLFVLDSMSFHTYHHAACKGGDGGVVAMKKLFHAVGLLVVSVAPHLPAVAQGAPAAPPPSRQLIAHGAVAATQVSSVDIAADALRWSAAEQSKILTQPQNVETTAGNIYARRVLAQEAERAGLADTPQMQAALRQARERVLAGARLAQLNQQAEPDAKALEAYARGQYSAEPSRFVQDEQVRVRHILIPRAQTDARAAAEAVLAALAAGSEFAALAREKSADSSSAARGGDLGFIGHGQMVRPFEDAAFALKNPGDRSGVVESEYGFHVIELVGRRPARTKTFDEVKQDLMAAAKAQKIENAQSQKMAEIMQGVDFDAAAIAEVARSFASQQTAVGGVIDPAAASRR